MRKNWPDGVKMGVALTFDLDAETFWFSRTMDSMYSPNLMAEGAYGPKVGVPRILEMLDRQQLKATFFIPGWVIEHHTETCREIVRRGHEIGYHGYNHMPLVLDNFDYGDEFDTYKQWESPDDIRAAMT